MSKEKYSTKGKLSLLRRITQNQIGLGKNGLPVILKMRSDWSKGIHPDKRFAEAK